MQKKGREAKSVSGKKQIANFGFGLVSYLCDSREKEENREERGHAWEGTSASLHGISILLSKDTNKEILETDINIWG